MDPHLLHLISYTTWDFKSLLKDDFRVGRHDLNFRVVKTTCNLHNFFNLLAKFWVRLLLYCRKIVGLSEDLVLFFWCSFGVVLKWSLPPLIIFSRVWFTIFEEQSSGYWFLVQQVLFLSRALSKANQLEVALKTYEPSLESHFYYAEAVHSCENSVLFQSQLVFDTNDRWYYFCCSHLR